MFTHLKSVLNFCLPTTCVLCGSHTQRELALCQACDVSLPRILNACIQCGISLSEDLICGQCLITPPPFTQTIALFHYQTPVDYCISALKFQQQLVYARVLGQLLADKIEQVAMVDIPDCIIPVPLHPLRLRERGYNQALEIAKPIAKRLQLPLLRTYCVRLRNTQPQSATAANLRQQNIKDAFAVVKPLKKSNAHVAIIDDVVTTTQTVVELSQCLMKAGVRRVDVWCCARTELGRE